MEDPVSKLWLVLALSIGDLINRLAGAELPDWLDQADILVALITSIGLVPLIKSSDLSRDIFINASGLLSGTPIFVTEIRADCVIPVPRIFVRLSVV